MSRVKFWQIFKDQFYCGKNVPKAIARRGVKRIQVLWVLLGVSVALLFGLSVSRQTTVDNAVSAVLAANAILTVLSLTMAMFFWPRAINLKNEVDFTNDDRRWHIYMLTTQLFWTVLVGVCATGIALVMLAVPDKYEAVLLIGVSVAVGMSAYQVLLLGQSVFKLYAATFWMPRA